MVVEKMYNFYFIIFINICILKNIGKILKCVWYIESDEYVI